MMAGRSGLRPAAMRKRWSYGISGKSTCGRNNSGVYILSDMPEVLSGLSKQAFQSWLSAQLLVLCKMQGFFAFFEFAAQDFARRNFGDRVDELHVVELFVAGQLAIGKGDQFLGGNAVAWSNDHKAFGYLACFVIRHTDDGSIQHGRMLQQQGLDLGRGNAEAFVFDHLLFAIYDVGVAIGIHVADIPGMEPAVAQGVGCFFRSFPVALHNLRTTNDDLSIFPDG